jgi:hypothetical protein
MQASARFPRDYPISGSLANCLHACVCLSSRSLSVARRGRPGQLWRRTALNSITIIAWRNLFECLRWPAGRPAGAICKSMPIVGRQPAQPLRPQLLPAGIAMGSRQRACRLVERFTSAKTVEKRRRFVSKRVGRRLGISLELGRSLGRRRRHLIALDATTTIGRRALHAPQINQLLHLSCAAARPSGHQERPAAAPPSTDWKLYGGGGSSVASDN